MTRQEAMEVLKRKLAHTGFVREEDRQAISFALRVLGRLEEKNIRGTLEGLQDLAYECGRGDRPLWQMRPDLETSAQALLTSLLKPSVEGE